MKVNFLHVLYRIYLVILFTAWIISLVRFKRRDGGLRIFSLLLGLTFIAECLAYYCAIRYRNNMPVYAIFNLIQLFLVCLYFNFSIDIFKGNNAGIYVGLGSIAAGLVNIVTLQPLQHLNNYFLFFEGIITISLSLISFTRLMLLQQEQEDGVPLYYNPHFWLSAGLTFFWTATFLSWGLYEFMIVRHPQSTWVVNLIILLVNMVTYGGISIVLFTYPKMRHER